MHRQASVVFNAIDSLTPLNEPQCGKYKKSFAYYTIKERLPVILTKIVDLLVRNKDKFTSSPDVSDSDLKTCIGKISKLKNEVQTNKKFLEITSKGVDVKIWNDYLAEYNSGEDVACWFESPWLYSECYMYRRLYSIFEESKLLNGYDYFASQKNEALEKCLDDVKIVESYLRQALLNYREKEQEHFLTLIRVALWSNRCDLSITAGKNLPNNQLSLDLVKTLDNFLLHDDSRRLFNFLSSSRLPGVTIDYVIDNSGYEVFCDLCFCDFLCHSGSATRVRFHVKKFPWYVSDATQNDIKLLLGKIREIGLDPLADRWERYFRDSIWSLHDDTYWTTPFDYNEMPERGNRLYDMLCESTIVVFKGDLNYRKLLRDLNWKFSEKHDVVLGKFRPAIIVPLRTIKSEVLCGIAPGKWNGLPEDLSWMRTGEYGVIQLWM